jgi:hypothetical protein
MHQLLKRVKKKDEAFLWSAGRLRVRRGREKRVFCNRKDWSDPSKTEGDLRYRQ